MALYSFRWMYDSTPKVRHLDCLQCFWFFFFAIMKNIPWNNYKFDFFIFASSNNYLYSFQDQFYIMFCFLFTKHVHCRCFRKKISSLGCLWPTRDVITDSSFIFLVKGGLADSGWSSLPLSCLAIPGVQKTQFIFHMQAGKDAGASRQLSRSRVTRCPCSFTSHSALLEDWCASWALDCHISNSDDYNWISKTNIVLFFLKLMLIHLTIASKRGC